MLLVKLVRICHEGASLNRGSFSNSFSFSPCTVGLTHAASLAMKMGSLAGPTSPAHRDAPDVTLPRIGSTARHCASTTS